MVHMATERASCSTMQQPEEISMICTTQTDATAVHQQMQTSHSDDVEFQRRVLIGKANKQLSVTNSTDNAELLRTAAQHVTRAIGILRAFPSEATLPSLPCHKRPATRMNKNKQYKEAKVSLQQTKKEDQQLSYKALSRRNSSQKGIRWNGYQTMFSLPKGR